MWEVETKREREIDARGLTWYQSLRFRVFMGRDLSDCCLVSGNKIPAEDMSVGEASEDSM